MNLLQMLKAILSRECDCILTDFTQPTSVSVYNVKVKPIIFAQVSTLTITVYCLRNGISGSVYTLPFMKRNVGSTGRSSTSKAKLYELS